MHYQEVSAESPNAGGHFYVENTTDSAEADDGWRYDEDSGRYYIVISDSGDYTIKKACLCKEGAVHEGFYIYVTGKNVNLTIEDVRMKATSSSYSGYGGGLIMYSTVNLKLILVGTNSFTGASGYAGIHFPNGTSGSLEITSETTGILYAYGGDNAAGIGGGTYYPNGNNITISGGTVYAYGGSNGSGIGDGNGGTSSDITISGANVTAVGNSDGLAHHIDKGGNSSTDATDIVFENVIGDTDVCLSSTGTCVLVAYFESTTSESDGLTQVVIVDTSAN